MKCYYEELGISREASDADIKTAYRKLALRWHPDKNPDCIEEAKEQFQVIQQAYDVLSDSHERAWYDNHREQILRGKNSEYEDKCLDLFQYFTVSCFKGYGDDEQGFYKVYSQVFEKIASEDAEFMDDEIDEIPTFGYSASSYEEFVGPFYAYWQSYCTKKTYSWLCPYDLQEIKDRRVLREIEKDLKKIVQKAKKERNEEVRNLVSFVRKRDKRVQNYKKLLEDRAAINRLKQEQNRLDQIRKRKREVEEMQKLNNSHAFNECYEEQLKQLEQQYEDESSYEEEVERDIDANLNDATEALSLDEEEYDYINQIYCVACNKTFKNEKALANHELSKKHRDNIQRLQEEMEQENDEIFQNEKISEEKESEMYIGVREVHVEDSAESEEEVKEVKKERKEKKSKKPNKSYSHINTEDSDQNHSELNGISHETEASRESEDVDWDCSNKRSSGKKSKNKQSKNKPAEVKTKVPQETPAQRASPVAASPTSDVVIDTDHTCVTCKANFESKNKLFTHLKKVNHGVYIPKTKASKTIPLETSKKTKSKRK